MESDEELVRRARAGEVRAFGVFVERHQKAVAGFCLSLLHDLDAAEEAAQAALVEAFKSLGSFEGRSSFKTWVSRIALNLARSQLRRARFMAWLPSAGEEGEERWEERLREAAPAGEEREALERRLDLERAMEALSPREKEMAAMRLEGYTLGEIAEAFGVSEGTVKSAVFSATQKMRRRLQ